MWIPFPKRQNHRPRKEPGKSCHLQLALKVKRFTFTWTKPLLEISCSSTEVLVRTRTLIYLTYIRSFSMETARSTQLKVSIVFCPRYLARVSNFLFVSRAWSSSKIACAQLRGVDIFCSLSNFVRVTYTAASTSKATRPKLDSDHLTPLFT